MALIRYCLDFDVRVIFTTGGTGFAERDVTPEATRRVITKEAPQLANLMFIESLKKTKFAVLSRAVCGIRKRTLIVNMPGSVKAVRECFEAISSVIPHAVELIRDEKQCVRETHAKVQQQDGHVCPHKTGLADDPNDRNSTYPMIEVKDALDLIYKESFKSMTGNTNVKSPINIPPFRASIKDGYAVRLGGAAIKRVIGYINAGDPILSTPFGFDECYKINTGAPVPDQADAIVQVEDTVLVEKDDNGIERTIKITVEPKKAGLDIRAIGSDLRIGETLFDSRVLGVPEQSLNATVGIAPNENRRKAITIAIISTGAELTMPGQQPLGPGKIYDSNTTMLSLLLEQFGFDVTIALIADDSYEELLASIESTLKQCHVVICSGGVSMGDKDFVKQVIIDMGFEIRFGRVNMKPGKPMTFGVSTQPTGPRKFFFGLPGNPVSAFVCFHLFVLACLRWLNGWSFDQAQMSVIKVKLANERLVLDPRPEYARATVVSKAGELWAEVTGDQISSRLKSIVGADVLIHLPQKSKDCSEVIRGAVLDASVLKHNFISKYVP